MSIYETYEQEISKIRRSGNTLLRYVKRHETLMNQRKQRMIPATFTDCYKLYSMAVRLLRMLALIKTYRYYQLLNIILTKRDTFLFYRTYDIYYQDYLKNFTLKIKQLQIIN